MKKIIASALVFLCILTGVSAIGSTEKYLLEKIKSPTVAQTGGEWAVLGLCKAGAAPESFYKTYLSNAENYVRECKGVLSERKYTEYSRVIIALSALGRDARSFAGYDLVKPLFDFDATLKQGINGAVWALLAFDSGDYPAPRARYIEELLAKQHADGGWGLSETSDTDISSMALCALAKYRALPDVAEAVKKGTDFLAKQKPQTTENTAQMLCAACELQLFDDPRFSYLEAELLNLKNADGGFKHDKNGGDSDLMTTEQANYALVSLNLAKGGKGTLFSLPPLSEKAAFSDILGHKYRRKIEKLAENGIINGMGDGSFSLDGKMTRAQFCAIVVRAAGIPEKKTNAFSDVDKNAWYAGFIGAAYEKGIINGVGNGFFAPNGLITAQEAACMTERCAALSVKTAADAKKYPYSCASWAQKSAAFCVKWGILDTSKRYDETLSRADISSMIYELWRLFS